MAKFSTVTQVTLDTAREFALPMRRKSIEFEPSDRCVFARQIDLEILRIERFATAVPATGDVLIFRDFTRFRL